VPPPLVRVSRYTVDGWAPHLKSPRPWLPAFNFASDLKKRLDLKKCEKWGIFRLPLTGLIIHIMVLPLITGAGKLSLN
jgi:hypothetical protein